MEQKIVLSNVEEWLYNNLKREYNVYKFKRLTFSDFGRFDPDIPLIIETENIADFTEIGSLEDLLHLAIKFGKIKKIIFLSSYCIYSPKEEKFKETDIISPMNFIGLKSAALEQALMYFARNYNISAVSLRLFNCYGPYQLKPFVVPTILEEIASKGEITIGDSEKVRDFVYISDLIELIKKILNIQDKKLSIYNVGSGKPTSIHDLIIKSQEVANGLCNIVFDAFKLREEYDYDYAVADISKIKKDLDWEPKVSLEQGLSLTYQWLLGRSQR